MKFTTTPAGRSTHVLEVELPPERVQQAIQLALRHLAQRTRVAGFRPGKAPRALLERALGVRRAEGGPDPVYDEARDHLFEQTVVEALRQTELDPVTIPRPEWISFAEGEGASYRVTIPVRPEVKLGSYTDYPFRPEIEPVGDDKVDQVIDQLRDQHSSLVPVEGRAAQNGDYAVISFEGTRDGVAFEGGAAERFPLVIGAERMIPGFEPQLVGLAEGEEKDFDITFPDDYPDQTLAGNEAHFHVAVRELREKRLPEADDDFAATLGEYASLDELRTEIRRRLEVNSRDRARHA
jgi:trigger factor